MSGGHPRVIPFDPDPFTILFLPCVRQELSEVIQISPGIFSAPELAAREEKENMARIRIPAR